MEYTNLKYLNKSVLQSYLKKHSNYLFFNNVYGLEREGLRVENFVSSPYSHPEIFGLKTKNNYITTDFAENQLELISPTFNNIAELYKFNESLYDIVSKELQQEEIIWPISMPCDVSSNVFESKYDDSASNELYRKYLTSKYGKEKQMISGIHFNFSFNHELVKRLHQIAKPKVDFKDFKNDVYLKVVNNYQYYAYLVTLFLGASPECHESYGNIKNVYSIRNSKYGYCNKCKLDINYSSVEKFISDVNKLIEERQIIDEREIYSAIRIKNGNTFVTQNLRETGIEYVELRNIDLNPYFKGGVNQEDLYFIELLLIYCLFSDVKDNDVNHCLSNNRDLSQFHEQIIADLEDIKAFVKLIDESKAMLIDQYLQKYLAKDLLTFQVIKELESLSFRDFGYKYGLKYKANSASKFGIDAYVDMELSTQLLIKEAIKRGIKVEIIDRADNFIKLTSLDGRVEYVKQATKTSRDSYISVLAMENKVITKALLSSIDINVPKGEEFGNQEQAYQFAIDFNKAFVIKPKSTNYGKGISIFKDEFNNENIRKAITYAFSFDTNIIIEEYVDGLEFRILIIDNQISGILHRVPANVIGDGKATIKELIAIKNESNLRGIGYIKPLEKIQIDEVLKIFLDEQGLNLDSVVKKGKQIYLRDNSNISNGGDSIDFTDLIPKRFKDIAINAAKNLDLTFCGVDMIIEDYTDESSNYAIIELNFNPAIHIHMYPFSGKGRDVATDILKALELI